MPNVLVVDDDVNIRKLVSMTLRMDGYTVEEAKDGEQALESYKRVRPDVLILDLRMPGLDGPAVLRRIEATGTRPPVIILSAYGSEVARRALGAEASLEKPFDPGELSGLVEQLV